MTPSDPPSDPPTNPPNDPPPGQHGAGGNSGRQRHRPAGGQPDRTKRRGSSGPPRRPSTRRPPTTDEARRVALDVLTAVRSQGAYANLTLPGL
ncbi:MAG TPA: hypothetical protein VHN80_18665, partial [Kineosporiaceae bacterium]|nr:hypothetical protein [Kineosporiaceae bacterium]